MIGGHSDGRARGHDGHHALLRRAAHGRRTDASLQLPLLICGHKLGLMIHSRVEGLSVAQLLDALAAPNLDRQRARDAALTEVVSAMRTEVRYRSSLAGHAVNLARERIER